MPACRTTEGSAKTLTKSGCWTRSFIRLDGTIELGQIEEIHEFVADVLHIAAIHISPPGPFYTMQEMLEKGKRSMKYLMGRR